MNIRARQTILAVLACTGGVLAVLATGALGQRAGADNAVVGNAPAPVIAPAETPRKLPPLRVYEWGVTTLHWDGTPEPEEEMPAAFYSADRIPQEPPQNRGAKPQPTQGGAKPRKPVIYIEHDLSASARIVFDLDVAFPNGQATWAYPRPSRRVDAATIQWDNLELVNAATAQARGAPVPSPAKLPAGHWSVLSREGSATAILAGNEVENYLFYEGDQYDLPELDLFKAADGSLHIHNHGIEAVHYVRVHLAVGSETQHHYVASIPAASAERAAVISLDAKTRTDALPPAGTLTREAESAGLTPAQARVFEAIWRNQLHGVAGTISWRRGPKALERMAEIRLTLPEGMYAEIHRLGYVLASRVDLSRQDALDAQAARAATGDAEAAKVLKQAGMAGAGALRRLAGSQTLALGQRITVARLLAEMGRPQRD